MRPVTLARYWSKRSGKSKTGGEHVLKLLAILAILSIAVASIACTNINQTPTPLPMTTQQQEPTDTVIVNTPQPTSTPEPTSTPQPTWTPEPTYTPQPTWTPQPTPTPTATPLPTPTPTLRQYAEQNAGGICLSDLPSTSNNRVTGDRPITNEIIEIIANDDSGNAFVKIKSQGHDGRLWWNHFQYQPGPIYGTGACKPIGYQEYPLPDPETEPVERIKQVAAIAEEICRASSSLEDWGRPPEEVRPTTETYALIKFGKYKSAKQVGQRPIHTGQHGFAVYNIETNTCEETAWAASAWTAWPEIIPQP